MTKPFIQAFSIAPPQVH